MAVQTVKYGLKKASTQTGTLEERLQKFLLYHRVMPQSTTGLSPSELLLKRRIRTRFDLLRPNLSSKVKQSQSSMTAYKGGKTRTFMVGDGVLAKNFSAGPTWLRGQVVEIVSPSIVVVRLNDGRGVRRHLDQVRACSIVESNEEHSIEPNRELGEPVVVPDMSLTRPVTQVSQEPSLTPEPNVEVRRNPLRGARLPSKLHDYILSK